MDGTGEDKPSASMKKRPATWQFMRAALFMLRKCVGPTKPKVVEKRILENLVGAMRPLHHNIDQPATVNQHCLETGPHKLPHEVHVRPPPPLPGNDDKDNDDDMLSFPAESRYASADNLLELDESEGEPNAIDMKAEEFIAKFYEQIRLQRLDSINRFNEEGAGSS